MFWHRLAESTFSEVYNLVSTGHQVWIDGFTVERVNGLVTLKRGSRIVGTGGIAWYWTKQLLCEDVQYTTPRDTRFDDLVEIEANGTNAEERENIEALAWREAEYRYQELWNNGSLEYGAFDT
jgi:hypothetical protein